MSICIHDYPCRCSFIVNMQHVRKFGFRHTYKLTHRCVQMYLDCSYRCFHVQADPEDITKGGTPVISDSRDSLSFCSSRPQYPSFLTTCPSLRRINLTHKSYKTLAGVWFPVTPYRSSATTCSCCLLFFAVTQKQQRPFVTTPFSSCQGFGFRVSRLGWGLGF